MLSNIASFYREMYKRFFRDNVLDLAAQCAYYFMLALFPFLLVVISVLSYLPFTVNDIANILRDVAPHMSEEIVFRNVREVVGVRERGLLSLGIVFTIWPALSGIESLMRALNYSAGLGKSRGYFRSKLLALVLIVGLILAICSALFLTVLGPKILELLQANLYIPDRIIWLWNYFSPITSFLILTVVFLSFYIAAPVKKIGIVEALPGCLFASIGWHYTSLGFSYYVSHFNDFSTTYGSLGAIIILMIWFYLTSLILIVGGQINSVLQELKSQK